MFLSSLSLLEFPSEKKKPFSGITKKVFFRRSQRAHAKQNKTKQNETKRREAREVFVSSIRLISSRKSAVAVRSFFILRIYAKKYDGNCESVDVVVRTFSPSFDEEKFPRTPPKEQQRARMNATASTSEAKKTSRTNEKTVILVRHGKTEMNEYLASNHWADEKFKDPLLYDTKLSKAGVAGAQLAQVYVEKLEPKPELIVASPLSRAIMTAKYVFEHDRSTPRAVCAHARERVFHASDHGKTKRELEQLHADFDFSHIESYD